MPTPIRTPGLALRQLTERDQRVFAAYPQVARYFPAAAIEDARQRLSRTIERGDGPGLVIGAPGTGKSLLLQVLAAQYHERFDVVLPACARLCTRRAMLQSVLFELGLPYKMRDEGELRLSLLDHLLSEDCPTGLLLLVDEAQALSISLLDELRVLTNLVRGGVPRVRLVLAGSSALEESFAHPELESFSQRLSARCYLAPLSRDETSQYIRAQIAASGCASDDVFTADAWAATFDATDGVPRLVNQLCDRALQLALTKCCPRIDSQLIQEAWSDLQQLPTPWDTPAASAAVANASEVIEFGGLSEDIDTKIGISDDAILDGDATDLDADDAVITTLKSVMNLPPDPPFVARVAVDPFAEKFDEEEVVLDNFAAWDNLFRRETPRVENRRDPGFSTLVQAAIEASPVSASTFAVSDSPADEESPVEPPSDWPGLRLADVSDTAPSESLPLVAQSTSATSTRDGGLRSVLPVLDSNNDAIARPAVDVPVLVIEEDAPLSPGRPPVRREEYRHLFSRLRSG